LIAIDLQDRNAESRWKAAVIQAAAFSIFSLQMGRDER
jgi:hypothetical protein